MDEPMQAPFSAALGLSLAVHADSVDVELEGRQVALALSTDSAEHDRRRSAGVGAVTSTGMLHGLWLLPSGGTVPASEIPASKRARFRSEPGWVHEGPAGFKRLYHPAGVVTAAAVARARSADALRIAASLPPIFDRYVVANNPSRALMADAADLGLGVIAVPNRDSEIMLFPRRCVTGRPAVYRWWLAEIAYERWLQMNAHPVS